MINPAFNFPSPEYFRGRGSPWQTDKKIFGSNASELETSRPVKKCIFTYPTCIWHWGWSRWNFVKIFCSMGVPVLSCGVVCVILHLAVFEEHLTDRQTHDDSKYCPRIASSG